MKSFITIGLCTALSLTVYGCNNQPNSTASVIMSPIASSSTASTQTTPQKESESLTASESPNAETSISSSQPTQEASQTIEGRYWLGGTDQGMEVKGNRYRYYSEGGEQEWRSMNELEVVKSGVIFDGKVHWCLSTAKPKNAATCSESGWVSRFAKAPAVPDNMFEFRFFLRNDLEQLARKSGDAAVMQKDPRITRVQKVPCGVGAMAKVSRMPSPTDSLSPDRVVEVDGQNSTIQRWAKPVDSKVIAIAGNRILVTTDENQSYWIDTAGRITVFTETLSLPSPASIPYIKHPEFAASGIYSQRFSDLNSGDDRQIIAEASCT